MIEITNANFSQVWIPMMYFHRTAEWMNWTGPMKSKSRLITKNSKLLSSLPATGLAEGLFDKNYNCGEDSWFNLPLGKKSFTRVIQATAEFSRRLGKFSMDLTWVSYRLVRTFPRVFKKSAHQTGRSSECSYLIKIEEIGWGSLGNLCLRLWALHCSSGGLKISFKIKENGPLELYYCGPWVT